MAICYEVERLVPTSRSPERQNVGNLIRERRKELHVSQEAMARRVGLTLAGYRPWEYGERDLKSEDLPTWGAALEMTQAELASRLGLGQVKIETIYAAEIQELLARIPDNDAREDVMIAIRTMARLAGRAGSVGGAD